MNTEIGSTLVALAVAGLLAGCTAAASSAGPTVTSSPVGAASASAAPNIAGQLAAGSQLCADVLQNGYPGIEVYRADKAYRQWAAEARKAGRPSLAAALARVGAEAAVTYADEIKGRNASDALATYEQAADAAGNLCTSGAQ